jgi:hypothetical protein
MLICASECVDSNSGQTSEQNLADFIRTIKKTCKLLPATGAKIITKSTKPISNFCITRLHMLLSFLTFIAAEGQSPKCV